jgi:GTP-binding protein Era
MKSGFVAIAGRPNAGKSTLLNHILGSELSIVSPKAQTTREKVLGILTEKEGQIVFIDTPGIHKAREGGINAYMVQQAKEALEGASLIWYLVDPRSKLEAEAVVLELIAQADCPVFLLWNKSDLSRALKEEATEGLREAILARAEELKVRIVEAFPLSGLRGLGIDALMGATWERLEEGPLYYEDPDQLSDRPLRFFVAEKIREQLFKQLGDEVPYSCAVEVLSFDESSRPLRIEAVIYVERESQKGMVVGAGGSKIKTIGQAARKGIEEFLGGGSIFLGLRVKLLKDWTRDAEALRRLGYNLPRKRAEK